MELRREKSKLLCKRRDSTDLINDGGTTISSVNTRPISTPVRTNNPSEDEESPYFPCSTQESHEGVDVLWDWNSPQSKPKTSITRKSRKRLNLVQSPKVPLRRHPSNNDEKIKQDFSKLREELRALKAEIAKPDNEDSLILSPREEEVFRREEIDSHMTSSISEFDHNVIEELFEDDLQDPFDDDMDEKLCLFSQQIETNLEKPDTRLGESYCNIGGSKLLNNATVQSNSNTCMAKSFHSNANTLWNKNQPNLHSLPKTTINNHDNMLSIATTEGLGQKNVNIANNPYMTHQKKTETFPQKSTSTSVQNGIVTKRQDSEIFNDSFDIVLSQMKEEDFDQLTQVVDIKQYKSGNNEHNIDKKSKIFPRSLSEDLIVTETVQMTSGKVEWHRTQSFESYNAELSKEKLLEIERKRLEAKAKRDAKKKQEIILPITEDSESPIKCSPDEIEKKRLQARERLEAKRLQDIIERNKQEALKRREEIRKRKAANVKSFLSTRL